MLAAACHAMARVPAVSALLAAMLAAAVPGSIAFAPAPTRVFAAPLPRRGRCAAGAGGGGGTTSGVAEVLRGASVLDPATGAAAPVLQGLTSGQRALVVLAPQLGDFDSAEYAEQLAAAYGDLGAADIGLRFVGIGDAAAAKRFAAFNGLPLECVRVDPCGSLHARLQLHAGPDWDVPPFMARLLPADAAVQARARAWLNYMAMCAGLGSRGTLREIARGYLGDKDAPERLAPDAVVEAGPVRIMGVRRVKLGPLEYDQLWKEERGYQRPVELATVRLRVMVEVLANWREYVSDDAHLARRGATFLLDADGSTLLYEHRDTGVLTYSATMPRPLSFLEPYIGAERAGDPQGFAKLPVAGA